MGGDKSVGSDDRNGVREQAAAVVVVVVVAEVTCPGRRSLTCEKKKGMSRPTV